ncbi:MAG: NAD(P)H-hydrate dehydratase [Dehalococcoidia bacterium]|nr:NAD(P)H-hydrate dehydratase [Dehalococcoidia bacterium]
MKIVTVDQMQALEVAADKAGVTVDALMEKAGLAVADHAIRHLGSPRGARVLVLVGPGNNGGDGLVAARYLHQWGARVQIYLCAPRKSPDPNFTLAEERGIPIATVAEDPGLDSLKRHLASTSLIIDAVLGTGKARPIEGQMRDILLQVADARRHQAKPLLAVDLPTGLDADTGAVDPACPGADITVTLGYPKIGHFTFPGAATTGRLEIADIGIPPGLDGGITLELVTPEMVRPMLPSRPIEAHKGSFGRLLVVAGSRNYVGASYLACLGAYRAGAGLVTLATPRGVYPIAAAKLTETTYLPLPETWSGSINSKAASDVMKALEGYAALSVGCGLSQDPETQLFVHELLLDNPALADIPTVLDADALNALTQVKDWPDHLKNHAVLTPHPGEMARLTGMSTAQVQEHRLEVARKYAQQWRQVLVLKGAFTVVASPQGAARISPFANPGLASAGTGDVLAGVIGGLLAQGLSPLDAATCGVYLHGAAGEELRHQLGDAGLLASDLLPEIPRRIKALKGST